MTAARFAFSNLQTCSDCGGVCRNRAYRDPDNVENVAGIPACTCRPRRPTPSPTEGH